MFVTKVTKEKSEYLEITNERKLCQMVMYTCCFEYKYFFTTKMELNPFFRLGQTKI